MTGSLKWVFTVSDNKSFFRNNYTIHDQMYNKYDKTWANGNAKTENILFTNIFMVCQIFSLNQESLKQ